MPTPSFSTQSWIETLPRPAAVIHCDHTIEAVNELFRTTFEAKAELVGQPCYKVLHGSNRPCSSPDLACPLDSCLASRKSAQSVHLHACGSRRSATRVSMRPLRKKSGISEDVLGTFEVLEYVRAADDSDVLIGDSDSCLTMLQEIDKATRSTAPILLLGESGTGRRFIARTLHRASPWSRGLFKTIDCRCNDESRFESSLLACVESAHATVAGLDRGSADRTPLGTLFLSEVNYLSPPLQSRLLFILDSRVFGSDVSSQASAGVLRLVCSADTDLEHLVATGSFRGELASWLRISPIRVPSLRERRADIPLLAESLLARAEPFHQSHWLSKDAMEVLGEYDFPGNIRELAQVLERARVDSPDRIIRSGMLLLDSGGDGASVSEPKLTFGGEIVPLRELTDAYLEWASSQLRCSHRKLAKRLGVSERTLYRKLSKNRKQASIDPTNADGTAALCSQQFGRERCQKL